MKRFGGSGDGALALAAIALALGACSQAGEKDQGPRVAVEPICSGAQAISTSNLLGTSLSAKTLSLSFDDGPGVRAAELSAYLKTAGIQASFFVNGRMLTGGTAVLQQLVDDGHFIGNHTQTHRSLTGRSTAGSPLPAQQVVSEVAQTDALIAPFVGNRFVFRAPFGDFDADTAAAINASPMQKYVGPINWDVGDHMGPAQAADWDCWIAGHDGVVLEPEECGDLYVKEIESVGRGIVLLHDPYFIDNDPLRGGTVDMVKYIVPILKAKGYAFVRIDQVPDIAALLPAEPAPAGVDAGTPGGPEDAGFETAASEHDAADARTPPGGPCSPARPRSR
jgi:peptidoglycan/xylan/chitin deacetylase (PgdA/CDA1 family)